MASTRSLSSRARLILEVLVASEEEGEDVPLSSVVEDVLRKRPELAGVAEELRGLLDLPPRVAIAALMRDDRWREALREAAEAYLPRLRE